MKKIFRMALVFALAGATLVYTGCTKDYAEEIDDLNKEIASTRDELKSVKDALAKAQALAEAAATKSELSSEVSTLNTAIKNLETAVNGDIDDLEGEVADLWDAIDAIDKKIEGEGGLRDAINDAKAAIAAIFNQIQSVVFVPEYVGEGIPFAVWKLGESTVKTKPTAITTFKVTPAAKAIEVGTKYKAAVNVAPIKTRSKTAEAPDHSDKVSVISADANTGYVQVAIEIDTTYEYFAVSLELKEAESKTEIVSDYVPAVAIGNVDLFGLLELKSATAAEWKRIDIKYDDDTQHSFFETFSPKFVFNDSEYTREEIAKAFPGLGLTWADTVKVDCSEAEAFMISDTTANFPAKVKLAKAKSDSAFKYVGETAIAAYTVKFATTASTQSLDVDTLGTQSAKIVKSISDKPIVTAPVVFYWNYENYNGTTFADNSLPIAEGDVEWVADDDLSDFVGPINLFGVVTTADFAKADGNIDSLCSYIKPATGDFITTGELKYKDAKNVDLTLNKNNAWPDKDTTYYEVYGFEKNETQFALAIPVTIKAEPADIVVEKYDITVKKGASTYKFEDLIDHIFTPAFENKLVDGLSGKTEKKADAWIEFIAAIATPSSKTDKFFENGDVTKTPASKLASVRWSDPDNADLTYTFNNGGFTKYADCDSATVNFAAFGVKITVKTLIKAEKAPAYALGFITGPRLTISADDPKNASAYAALNASTGKPETAYMNQFVNVVRPAGTTNDTYIADARTTLKVEFSKFAQTKTDTLDIDDAELAGSLSFAPISFSTQKTLIPDADTLKAYIADNDPAVAVKWGDTTHVRTIPVKAVLYCDGIALDSVIVNVWTDDPFAGEGAAFEGYNFKFDASEREDKDIEMAAGRQTFAAYDSLTVKSPIYEDNLVAGNISNYPMLPIPTITNGIVEGRYYYTEDAIKLGVKIWVAPVKDWTYNNGEKVIDNPTNFGWDEAHGRVTLKKGVKLTEDVTVTIPIKLYYTLGGPLSSQVTVTFTK